MGNGHMMPPASPQFAVSAPFNDYQLVALMSAHLLAGHDLPAAEDQAGRTDLATRAALLSLELLGHGAYYMGQGLIASAVRSGQAAGAEVAKQRVMNEPSHEPAADDKKIITGE